MGSSDRALDLLRPVVESDIQDPEDMIASSRTGKARHSENDRGQMRRRDLHRGKRLRILAEKE
jgi:hypothetical protein